MRHMDWLFEGLGLPSDKENRQRVDTALRELLETPEGAHCPEIWTAIKELSAEERSALVPRVRDLLKL
jgi:hypothetical protein